MRGGLLHRTLVEGLANAAAASGFWVRVEAGIRGARHASEVADKRHEESAGGNRVGFGDLVVGNGRHLLLIEVELDARRIWRDLEKGRRLRATEIWIVAGHVQLRDRIKRKLTARGQESGVLVLCYPQAIQRLTTMGGIHDRGEHDRDR